MEFTERLKTIIKLSGLSRDDFAKKGGISRSQLFRYLNGEQEPSTSFYRNIKAHHSWINTNWLISGEGEPDLRAHPSNVVPLDQAVRILNEAIEETGIDLNTDQREAVVKILREELAKSEGITKGNIKNWISALSKKGES